MIEAASDQVVVSVSTYLHYGKRNRRCG